MRRMTTLLTGIVFAMTMTTLAAAPAGKIVEKQTKTKFVDSLDGTQSGNTLTCTGVACRKMTAFGVKIYAVAHWIDAAAAAKTLASWHGRSASELADDQSFYDALATVDVEKRLRLVFVHKATGKQVSEGFEESLEITYKKLPPEAKQFLGMLNAKLKVGDPMELRWIPGGTIEVYEKGKHVGAIEKNPEFAAAVWKMWFGAKLADKHLDVVKKNVIGNVDALWTK